MDPLLYQKLRSPSANIFFFFFSPRKLDVDDPSSVEVEEQEKLALHNAFSGSMTFFFFFFFFFFFLGPYLFALLLCSFVIF